MARNRQSELGSAAGLDISERRFYRGGQSAIQSRCIYVLCIAAFLFSGCRKESLPTPREQSLRHELIEAAANSDSFLIKGYGNVKSAEDFFEPLNPETIHAALESSSCIKAPDNIGSQEIGGFWLLQGERKVAWFDYCKGGRLLYKDECCLQLKHDPFFGCFK